MLPPNVHKELNFAVLERVNGAFVDNDLQESLTDVVYQCQLNQVPKDIWISFIFEHKGSPERYPHLQLLRYILGVWADQVIK
jgi:hypothetical protein